MCSTLTEGLGAIDLEIRKSSLWMVALEWMADRAAKQTEEGRVGDQAVRGIMRKVQLL